MCRQLARESPVDDAMLLGINTTGQVEAVRGCGMRQVVGFILASALLGGGLYLLYLQLFIAQGFAGVLLVAGGFFVFLGGAWLWADFIAPALKRKRP